MIDTPCFAMTIDTIEVFTLSIICCSSGLVRVNMGGIPLKVNTIALCLGFFPEE